MKNILVALDAETGSASLVELAAQWAHAYQAKVWLLHVAAPDPDFVGNRVGPQYVRDLLATELRQEHQVLQQFAIDLHQRGIEADALLIQGATAEMILDETEKLAADMVVIGRHEHGWLHRFFSGCTHPEIVNRSKVPVLIVPL